MARPPNFYYQDPTAEISGHLARAILGDPAAAAQQREQQAQNDERIARSRLLIAQGDGVENQNRAAASLPELLAGLRPAQAAVAAPIPSIDDPAFLDGAGPSAPAVDPQQAFVAGLPGVMAALAQMQGDKVDSSETVGTLASFLGGDELARRGMVAQGKTPGEDFALTSGRADAISARDAGESQAQAFGVANINHANDIPVANIRAGATTDAAGIRAGATRYTADVRASSSGGTSRGERNNNPGNIEMGNFARSQGATGSDGRFAIFPSYEAGVSAQEALLRGPGYIGGGRNTIDAIISRYAPPSDGNPVDNYADYVSRATGIARNQPVPPDKVGAVAEAMRQFETGNRGTARPYAGGRSRAPAAPKAPRAVSRATVDLIGDEITKYLDAGNISLPTGAMNVIRSRAITAFQQSGNPIDAVRSTMDAMAQEARNKRGAAPAAPRSAAAPARRPGARQLPGAPAPGARRAPDGKWYVVTGQNPDGSKRYSRVGD